MIDPPPTGVSKTNGFFCSKPASLGTVAHNADTRETSLFSFRADKICSGLLDLGKVPKSSGKLEEYISLITLK